MPTDPPYTEADVEALAQVLNDTFLDRSLDCWPDFEPEARAALKHMAARFIAEGRSQALGGVVQHVARQLGFGVEVVPDGEWTERFLTGALDQAREQGRRQATEGWEREWGVDLHGTGGQCVMNEHAARGIAADPSAPVGAKVLYRLVGSWETDEQPEPEGLTLTGHTTCIDCHDDLWEGEPGVQVGEGHRCMICEVRRQRPAEQPKPEPAPRPEPRIFGACPNCGKPVTDFRGEPHTQMANSAGYLETVSVAYEYQPCGCVYVKAVGRAAEQSEDDAHMAAMEERMEHEDGAR